MMPKYEITIPNRGKFVVESDKELSDEQAYQYALSQSQPAPTPEVKAPEDKSLGGTVVSAISNLPSSTANLFQGLYQAVTNPLETGKAVLDVAAGGLQNILPESVVQAIGPDERSRAAAGQVADFYRQRYGSAEGVRQTIAKDPAGFLADVSTVLSAGSLAAPRLGRVATAIDPVAATVRAGGSLASGAGRLSSELLGLSTGVGSEPIRQAARAGAVGGESARQFRENITGRAPLTDVLDAAKQNLADMNTAKQAEYRSGMIDIKRDKTVLDFIGIDDAVKQSIGKTTYKGKVLNKKASEELLKARDLVDEWKAANPNDFHTPEGMDALKQRIGDLLEEIPFEQKQARAAVGGVYNAVKKEIVKQAPTYANVMRQYSTASEQIREIERTLSLGDKASSDTALRKLQSLMRNNVNTNYGQRLNLARQLETQGGREIMPALAGQALSDLTPRGLSRIGSPGAALGAFSIGGLPPALAALAASSPRVVGEAAYAGGLLGRPVRAGLETARGAAPVLLDPRLYNILYQSGRERE
jgi:hypothetical protein